MNIRTHLTSKGRIRFMADNPNDLLIVTNHYGMDTSCIQKYKRDYSILVGLNENILEIYG